MAKLPSVYLGLPLTIDGNLGYFLDYIISKIRKNLSS